MKKQNYTEENFEVEHVLDVLVKENGYRRRENEDFSHETLLDEELVLEFVKNTQPEEWEKFERQYPRNTEKGFCKNLSKRIDEHGTVDVLRSGFKDRGAKFKLAYFKPFTKLNPEHRRLYEQNTFSVINQFQFSEDSNKTLDVVLFLNGLPIITAELKNHFTGQDYTDAIWQYRHARDPRKPFFKRCFAHFAVDNDKAFFTTELKGEATEFLPFNKDLENPDDPRGFKVAYLYYDIWHPDSLLGIISRFVQVVEKEGEEVTIFPRHHQLTAVRRLVQTAKKNGPGKNYLIHHSAGSGKTFTISWLAHQLSQIHDEKDKRIYDSAIVISDRKVIDRQLREAVKYFEKKRGVVGTASVSRDLRRFLEIGKNIIVTTVQKFPFVVDEIEKLEGSTFAVLIDEAHSSQGGLLSEKLKKTLTQPLEEKEEERIFKEESLEDQILRDIKRRGRLPHVSFFAFTATPKGETLELFGEKQLDGSYEPFSLYSMRQAIEEGFILDVLENYMTYGTYFKIVKTIEEDPEYESKKATTMLQRYTNLHEEAIKKKTSIMLDHFFNKARWQIGGKAKAMVVTRSRKMAVRYKLEFGRQLRERKADFKALVAFTGTVEDRGIKYTESNMNGFPESQTRKKFNSDEYRILIVAYKFQTGFDQPFLQTMYVDKRLQGLAAVQSLSRLNRKIKSKDHVFVLDFVNDPDTIQVAFQEYYEAIILTEETDPNKLYELEKRIGEFGIIYPENVDEFAKIWYTGGDQSELHRVLAPAVKRFESLSEDVGEEEAKKKKKEFRALLRNFVKLYAFVAQVANFEDLDLEKLYLYSRFLLKKLPLTRESLPREIMDSVDMSRFKVQEEFTGKIPLRGGDAELAPGVISEVRREREDEKARLSEIIDRFNEAFGGIFTEEESEKIGELSSQIQSDEELQDSIEAGNPRDKLILLFNDIFEERLMKMYERDSNFFKKIEDHPKAKKQLKEILFDFALKESGRVPVD